jgi:hypothetical protein
MDLDNDIIALVRAGDPASMRQAIERIRTVHGVSETTAYAWYVRAVATGELLPPGGSPPEMSREHPLLAS